MNGLVEQRIQTWLAEQRASAKKDEPRAPHRPIVTISREAGARGTELGRRVAERLGFRFWDQELVQQIAEQSGVWDQLFRVVDERARNAVEDLLAGIFMGDAFTGEAYLVRLLHLIRAIALQGSAVVVGRGGQFVVEPDASLRVRVVGPRDARARTLMAERRLSERQAHAEVERIDHERASFIRRHYKKDAADPSAYDLVVNSATLPVERAVDVVVAAYGAKFPAVPVFAESRSS
ncbi:MAG TPA: cytidylate kinase-like family protein [Polyangiaceae bacterium]